MVRAPANILAEFPFKLMEKSSLTAPPSNTYFARISQALKPVASDLNKVLKEDGLMLVPMWRCAHRNNRWRCGGVTHAPNTKCLKCRETAVKRERAYWAFKIISNSIKKDQKQMRQLKFIHCESCKIPMLPRHQPKRGRRVLQMCYKCRHLRLREQMKRANANYRQMHCPCPYNKIVENSGKTDKEYNRIPKNYDFRNDPRYLTVEGVKKMRQKQKNKCYYCKVAMETNTNRLTNPKGLQIERLTNGPHWAADCVLACNSCNRRSWREGWSPYPHDIARVIGQKFKPDRYPGFLEGTVEGRTYERQENGNYVETGTNQCTVPKMLPTRRCVSQMERIAAELRQLKVRS